MFSARLKKSPACDPVKLVSLISDELTQSVTAELAGKDHNDPKQDGKTREGGIKTSGALDVGRQLQSPSQGVCMDT